MGKGAEWRRLPRDVVKGHVPFGGAVLLTHFFYSLDYWPELVPIETVDKLIVCFSP